MDDGPHFTGVQDTQQYTVMSYNHHHAGLDDPDKLMLYDIAMLQHLYGANTSTNSGNNIYDLSNLPEHEMHSIWDAGGLDTLSAATATDNAFVDLRQGYFSTISINPNHFDNVSIAFGAIIENAVGSAFNDTIVGNFTSNVLRGSDGDDNIYGDGHTFKTHGHSGPFEGKYQAAEEHTPSADDNDEIYGGIGDDVAFGGSGADTIDGGTGSSSLYGGEGDDILIGRAVAGEADLLEGGSGNDTLTSHEGNDSLDGGQDADTLFAGGGFDHLIGGDGNDELHGDAGEDYILGGEGADSLFGGDDNDILIGGEGSDEFTGGDGDDVFIIGTDAFQAGAQDIVHDAAIGDQILLEGRLLTGAIRDVRVVDGVRKYGEIELLGASGERYEISGDVQDQGGAGITVTIHLPSGAGTVVLNDYQQGDGGVGLYDNVTTVIEEGRGKYGNASKLISPLVLDLDGDGIELTGLTSSQTYFDLDADGFAEKTGWVGGGDGLLALDRNADGVINDITELFGNATTDGFTELALLDSNTDGVINAGDTLFADLRVWIDSNRDGTTNAGELKTLSELEIESISLSATEVMQTQLGNEISHISSYIRSDGSQHEIVDAWFANDQLDTRYLGDTNVSAEVAALANLKGYGELAELQVASENDAVLKGLVAEFDTLPLSGIATLLEKTEAILFRWAGTQDLASDSRGDAIDARQLAAMEKLFGESFFQAGGIHGANPGPNAGYTLGIVWQEIVADTAAKLFLQSGQSGFFATVSYDFEKDLIVNAADSLDFQAFADAAPAGLEDKVAYWRGLVPLIQIVASASGLRLEDYTGDLEDKFNLTGVPLSLDELLISTPLSGGLGDDNLTGTSGRDLLDGGQGNDVMAGGEGGDTYIFSRGSGQDVINEVEDAVGLHWIDRLELLDIASTEVTLERNGVDLVVKIDGTSDQITITDQFSENNLGPDTPFRFDYQIEGIVFSDGVIWSEQDIREELLRGTSGNDTLTGFFAADRLDGGLGNDLLLGGDDADTYVFGLGYGQDQIYDEMKSIYFTDPDFVSFGSGITQDNITLIRTGQGGNDLVIEIDGTSDRLTIRDQFFAGNLSQDGFYTVDNRIEEFHFADASSLTDPQVRELLLTSTDGDDTLTGFFGVDTLDGGLGNDLLLGGDDADSYVFDIGYGSDRIDESQTSVFFNDPDKVIFGAGVNTADVVLSRLGDDLVFEFNGATDSLTIEKQFMTGNLGGTPLHEVELFTFSDGTTWTAAQVETMLLQSTDGDDTLVGYFSADTLDGGLGNDRLEGGNDGDSYIFDAGYGQDVIFDYQTSIFYTAADIVSFGVGISADDLVVTRTGNFDNDMLITFDGLGDTLRIEDFFLTKFHEIEEFHFADGMIWSLSEILSRLGTGTDGDDLLLGSEYADRLDGGLGNDRLEGSNGGDTYVFDAGYGQDVIEDYQSSVFSPAPDAIEFGAGINAADLILSRTGSFGHDMQITFNGSTDSLLIEKMLFNEFYEIEEFHFANGEVWSLNDIWGSLLGATAGNDVIVGTGNADVLSGLDGDDTLTGNGGSDSLIGGLGNDTLYGSDGSDTYIFTRGDGTDLIEDNGFSDTDRLVIHGYTPDEVMLGRAPAGSGHLVLSFAGTADQITIRNALDNSVGDNIEEYVFDDSTIWTPDDLRAMILTNTQTDGDDIVHGFDAGGDQLEGGLGNDELHGGDGSDDYIFARGDGVDLIEDDGYLSTDRLVIHGYTPDEVTIGRTSPTSNHIVLTFDGTGDQITVRNTLQGSSSDTIEQIVFDNGVIWTPADLRTAVLTGGDGNDTLNGFGTSDTLDGGSGNDRMEGKFGADTYIFDSGYGQDVIYDRGSSGDFDKVIFGAGISAADLSLSYSSVNANHLVVDVISTGDQLTIEQMFGSTSRHIEAFEFFDGSSWDRAEIIAAIAPPPAAATQASSDPFSGFRTLRDLFGDAEPSDDADAGTSLSLADLIDEPGVQDAQSLEAQIVTLLDSYDSDAPASPGGSAGDAGLASLAIFDAALVMPELPVEDHTFTQ